MAMIGLTKMRAFLILVALLVAALFLVDLQPVRPRDPEVVHPSPEALRIHREAIVIDLHVDSLLWRRELNRENQVGHVDFPRMRRGGLDAAAFTIATGFFHLAGLKALHDRQPLSTWFSSWERYRYQVETMRRFIEASKGRVRLATTAAAIRANHRDGVLSVFHGIEGAHALETDLDRVQQVAEDGVIYIGIVHLGANEYGGSSIGLDRGLTELGHRLIEEMNRVGLLVDLAHAGPKTFDEALAVARLPPIVSHTGARAIHESWRNLTDRQIREVARRGGVIGVMFVPPGIDRPDVQEVVEHLGHIVRVGGEDVAALGSDFDGSLHAPIDAGGLAQLTELMLRAGWSDTLVRKILGENLLRVLSERTPPDS